MVIQKRAQLVLFTLIFFITLTSCSNKENSFDESLVDSNAMPKETLLNLLSVMGVNHSGNLVSIVEATQKEWLRKPGQERWDIDPNQFKELENKAFPLLNNHLKINQQIQPSKSHYKGVILLGCTTKCLKSRYDFMNSQNIKADKYYYLVGERDLDPQIEAAAALQEVLHNNNIQALHTEADVMRKIIDAFPNAKENVVVSAPKKLNNEEKWVRPTTIDTLHAWLDKNPEPGNYLIISSVPHIRYQRAVCSRFLAEKGLEDKFKFETIGGKSESENFPILLDAVARELYETRLRFKIKKIIP